MIVLELATDDEFDERQHAYGDAEQVGHAGDLVIALDEQRIE